LIKVMWRKPGPGRKSKGERDAFYTSPAEPVRARVVTESRRLGFMEFSDYISAVLAEAVGLPQYAPQPKHAAQEHLALADLPAAGEIPNGFLTRPMKPVGLEIRANADQLGLTFGNYISSALAIAAGLPEHAPQPRKEAAEQEALPQTA